MLVYFGVGNIAAKTMEKYGKTPDFLVDNNESVQGIEWEGIQVYAPDMILKKNVKKIVICTTSYIEVTKQLLDMGIKKDVIEVTPTLDSIRVINEVESLEFDLLFVSGVPSHKSDISGGGLFRLRGNFSKYKLEKIYGGNCHSIVKNKQDNYVVTDNNDGLILFDANLNYIKDIRLPEGIRPHGSACIDDGTYVIAGSYDDSIVHVDSRGKLIKKVRISSQIDHVGTAQHHINDLCYYKGCVYVSMFSISGAWKAGFLDGGIIRVNLSTDKKDVVLDNLTMPHNIQVGCDGYYVCNSYDSELLTNNREVLYKSNGFVRGLCVLQDYYIICESKNRNFTNIKGSLKNPCLDSRINFVHKNSGAYISVQLPYGVTEIHSVISII